MENHFTWLDGLSIGSIVAAFAGVLPPIAVLLGIIWYCLLIYDWFARRLAKNAIPADDNEQQDDFV